MLNNRLHAYQILNDFQRTGNRLKNIRDAYFIQYGISGADRVRVLVLTNEVVRWQGRLDLWLESALDNPLKNLDTKVKTILNMGTYELLMDNAVPAYAAVTSAVDLTRKIKGNRCAGLVNAVLRKLSKVDPNICPGNDEDENVYARWLSFPLWMVKRWGIKYGENTTKALCEHFNTSVSMGVRLNVNKMEAGEFRNIMESDGIILLSLSNSDRFFRVKKGGNKLYTHDLFKKGIISIQDRGAGGIVELLDPQPGETILDVCAAPGTKTVYIGERMHGKGRIYASDVDEARLELVRDASFRQAFDVDWSRKDGAKDSFPSADRILIDAPCTGTGVIGRRPDIRWRRKEKNIQEMARIQLAILKNVSQYLKPGGLIVYGTCSLEEEENWNVVDTFLKLNGRFTIESGADYIPANWLGKRGNLETFPPRDQVDGMFAVRLRYTC